MSLQSRARGLAFLAFPALATVAFAQGVDIWTVGVDNTRQGWNRFETVLTPANVPKLRKIREFTVDEKIDVSPLVVGDKLYVFSMTNTAFVFDVNTGAQLASRQLAPPFDPADIANPPDLGMDLHNMYRSWGITATPVIDVADEDDLRHDVRQARRRQPEQRARQPAVDPRCRHARRQAPSLVIEGNADNGGGGISNGVHDALPEDAGRPRSAHRCRRQQGGGDLVLDQRREPARAGPRIRRRVRRARPQSRGGIHADAGDLERHARRRRRRRVDVGVRTCDRRRRHLSRHRQRHGSRARWPATSARAS